MRSKLWSRKGAALAAAVALCVCMLSFVMFSLASPAPISVAALGPDWQCSRVAFVLTSCTHVGRPKAVPVRDREDCPPGI
ncbi:hypothetical protein JQ615_19580 [Bradyrhizobium jicamae]|uniref:Secreted protein n=1 Tax=Bradyrhizobium jicamae TaxID=280332 RepID=A0ABS5FLC7_9BRAD|nr:hypothetical protein [Bradyrhizobium jicamae]MBR0797593.1 hypothetical protein [Bradyrhizobium jicamae]MBR0937256.1 hypothetical protein [Bradyrhizobium jicamae]